MDFKELVLRNRSYRRFDGSLVIALGKPAEKTHYVPKVKRDELIVSVYT